MRRFEANAPMARRLLCYRTTSGEIGRAALEVEIGRRAAKVVALVSRPKSEENRNVPACSDAAIIPGVVALVPNTS